MGAGNFTEENFNSYATDQSFNNGATVNVADFSLTGIGNQSGRNIIDAAPLVVPVFAIDGTIISGFTRATVGFNATFNNPMQAFGATFNGTSDSGITRIRVGSDIVGNVPNIANGATGFYGFIADGTFSQLTFESADGNNDGFGADNFVYSPPAPVPIPFEVDSSLGLLLITGWFGFRVWWKNRHKNQQPPDTTSTESVGNDV